MKKVSFLSEELQEENRLGCYNEYAGGDFEEIFEDEFEDDYQEDISDALGLICSDEEEEEARDLANAIPDDIPEEEEEALAISRIKVTERSLESLCEAAKRDPENEETVAEIYKRLEPMVMMVTLRTLKKKKIGFMHFEDIMQEAKMGIYTAIQKFDESRNDGNTSLFKTAYLWATRNVSRACYSNGRELRVPEYTQVKWYKIRTEIAKFNAKRGKPAEEKYDLDDEVIEAVAAKGFSEDDIRDAITKYYEDIVDLNAINPKAQSDSGTIESPEYIDGIPNGGDMFDEMSEREMQMVKDFLAEEIEKLSENDRYIMQHKFELDGCEKLTLKQIGETMPDGKKISKQGVQQKINWILAEFRKKWYTISGGLLEE